MRKMTEGNCTIIYWPADPDVTEESGTPEGVPVKADLDRPHAVIGSGASNKIGGSSTSNGCHVVPIGINGSVVLFPARLFDRWDSAVAGIGGVPGVTDSQLRDVFLLMVAEMSGMVASKGGGGNK